MCFTSGPLPMEIKTHETINSFCTCEKKLFFFVLFFTFQASTLNICSYFVTDSECVKETRRVYFSVYACIFLCACNQNVLWATI